MIPNHDLHRLVDVLVGDRLRANPEWLSIFLEGSFMVGTRGPVEFDPQHIAALARIASGEAYEAAS